MTSAASAWVLIVLAVIAANLPWVTDRVFLVWKPASGRKSTWQCLAAWLVMYLLIGLIAFGLERKTIGQIHAQDWEFFSVTFFLFVVFALPDFIYRVEFRAGPGQGPRGVGGKK